MSLFSQGVRVWVCDENLGWTKGSIITNNGNRILVKLEEVNCVRNTNKKQIKTNKIQKNKKQGEEIEYESKNIQELHEESLQNYDDMVKIDDLSEAVLLHNLQQRYLKDTIYVNTQQKNKFLKSK